MKPLNDNQTAGLVIIFICYMLAYIGIAVAIYDNFQVHGGLIFAGFFVPPAVVGAYLFLKGVDKQ